MSQISSAVPAKVTRVAIVGCGRIADIHVAALRDVPGVEIVAGCDLSEAVARERCTKHGIPGVYTDAETMLRDARPDVVHLLTPPQSHLALVRLAAAHGVHCYVEKPLASTEADARAIVEVAGASGIRVLPGHNRLFDPQFVEMKQRIAAGEIGRVVSARAEQGFSYEAAARAASIPWSYTYDWGIYENLIPHPLYLVSHFLRDPGEPRVAAFSLGRIREAGVEEIRVIVPSAGAIGEVALSMTTAPVQNRIEVVGTEGRLTADYVALNLIANVRSPLPGFVSRITSSLGVAGQLTRGAFGFAAGVLTGRVKQYMGLRVLVAEFYRALRAGAPSPVSLESGLVNVRQMERIREACASAAKVRLSVVAPAAASPADVLVTGATGFLGGRVVERLAADGVRVRATTRLASRGRELPNVEWLRCNLANDDELRAALQGVSVVYHCAAMAAAPGSLEDYEKANVKGSVRLAELAAEAGVGTLVYVSSISVYAMPRGSRFLAEDAAYDARAAERGVYTQSKLNADRAMRDYAARLAAPRVVILRPGTIYGPGVKLPIGRFTLPSPSKRRPVVAGGPGVPMPLTYVDNVIDAMIAAARSPVASGSVYNVIDAPDWDQGAVARALKSRSHGRLRPFFLPYPVVWSLMLAVDLVSVVRGRGMGTARYRLERTLADMRYRSEAARRDLGWTPRVGLEDGLGRVLEAATETPYPH